MEILNNIWSGLCTENEVLLKFILIPFTLLENYISLLLFSTLLKISCTKTQKFIYVICTSIVGIISTNFILAPINTVVNYIFLFGLIYTLFDLPIVKTILTLIIPFGVFSIIGTLILNPLLKIFNIELSFLDSIPIYRITYLCIFYILIFIIIYLLKLRNTNVNLLNGLNNHNKNIVILNLLLGIFTLIIQVIITVFYINILPLYITFLSSISLVLYFLISFYSLNHIMKLQKTTMDLENAENYNKTLSILYDNVKAFKHDFDDMINMIGGYINNNDMERIE